MAQTFDINIQVQLSSEFCRYLNNLLKKQNISLSKLAEELDTSEYFLKKAIDEKIRMAIPRDFAKKLEDFVRENSKKKEIKIIS